MNEESPAAIRGGALPLAVARLPQRDVGSAVFGGMLELYQAAADPVRAELGRPDLEVQVGLAARLRDLAPAGADLVALAGIDLIVGSVVGHLVDRDDGQCRSDVEGLERAREDAVVELGEGPEGDRHDVVSCEDLAEPVPAMSRVTRPQRRRRHREPASGRSTAEDLEGGRI